MIASSNVNERVGRGLPLDQFELDRRNYGVEMLGRKHGTLVREHRVAIVREAAIFATWQGGGQIKMERSRKSRLPPMRYESERSSTGRPRKRREFGHLELSVLLPRNRLVANVNKLLVLVAIVLQGCGPIGEAAPSLTRTLSGHTLNITSVAWSPDGKLIASGSVDRTAIVWEASTGRKVTTLRNFRGSVLSLAWSPDSQYLAVASDVDEDGVQIWDTNSWQPVETLAHGLQTFPTSIAWSPDGKSLAVVANDVEIWDIDSGQRTAWLSPSGGALDAKWSPNGKVLACDADLNPGFANEGGIRIWDPAKGDGQATNSNTFLLGRHDSLVESVAWSPDGKKLVSGGMNGVVKVWSLSSKQNLLTLAGHKNDVVSVAWSPDGTMIASGSWDATAKIWDATTGQNLETFQHPDYVTTVSWSPDSRYLATGDHETIAPVRIWEVKK